MKIDPRTVIGHPTTGTTDSARQQPLSDADRRLSLASNKSERDILLDAATIITAPKHPTVRLPALDLSSTSPKAGVSTRPSSPSPAQPRPSKAQARQQAEQGAKRLRRLARRAQRVDHIKNPERATIDNQKFDSYALNETHPYGRHKSRVFAQKGFKRVTPYERGNPDLSSNAANLDPGYIEGRESIKHQIMSNLGKTPAEVKPANEKRARMDTKHKIVGPLGTLTARVQWVYPIEGGVPAENPHLASIQPSESSSDGDGN